MTQSEKDDKLILSRAEDAVEIAERTYCTRAVGFLNPHQRSIIKRNVFPQAGIITSFEGGYPDAERTLFVCRPEYAEDEADALLRVIVISGRDIGGLTHRDYLGSIMGLGITRTNIGDILVGADKTHVFVKAEIADYIAANLEKVGNRGVKCVICNRENADIPKPKIKEIKGTVSSLRLDAVLSLAAGISRGRAAELISQGLISLNWETAESVSAQVGEGDLISARGFGRMRLDKIGGQTRKGRLGVIIAKFE